MTNRPPPVPPEQQGRSGPQATDDVTGDTVHTKTEQTDNADKRGQSGNSKVNTTNQGYQQDR